MTPQFPPLITGHALKSGQSPVRKAAAGAAKNKYGAGDLLWVNDPDTLDYAIVLEPEVAREASLQMVFTQMVALGDAIGAIAPPEVPITYRWPDTVLANGATIGHVSAVLADEDTPEGFPAYLVIATHLAIRPKIVRHDPGLTRDSTTLWDEGCGELDALMVLDSTARHFLNWVHTWEEDGFKPVLALLDGRMTPGHTIIVGDEEVVYLGLDEAGNALVKAAGSTRLITAQAVLKTSIRNHLS